MRRRAVLGALGASVGVFAGCAGQSRAGSGTSDAVTPAPVPTVEVGTADAPDSRVPSPPGCPLLPREADVYVCSPRPSPGELRLFPDRQRFVRTPIGPSDPLPITLQNSSQIPFETRRGWWVLTRNDANGWTLLDAGRNDERFDVSPGEAFVWRVGSDARSETVGRSHDVSATVSEGVYAFGVHGFHRDARLVALQAPFEVVVRP